jgi:hypothetical protein
MKADSVHGGGALFASMSERFGLRGQYGPCAPKGRGMATLSGREDTYGSMSRDFSSSPSDGSMSLQSADSRGLEGEADWFETEVSIEAVEVFSRRKGGNDFRLLITTFLQPPLVDLLTSSRGFSPLSKSLASELQHSDGCVRRRGKASLLGCERTTRSGER